MYAAHELAAAFLETGARGLASASATRLLDAHPEVRTAFGYPAYGLWKSYFERQILELSSAVLAAEPALFAWTARWSRRAFGRREVSAEHVRASLESLREVLGEELPESSGSLAQEFVDAGLRELESPLTERRLDGETREGRLALDYLEAALGGDRVRAIDLILEACDGGWTPIDLLTGVLASAQREVGTRWFDGELSVSHEHVVTATTHAAMTLLSRHVERAPAHGKAAMVAVPSGSDHHLGARIFSDLLEIEGWRAIHLGEAVPAAEIAAAVGDFDVDLLALSITLATQVGETIEAVKEARAVETDVKILVGGPLLEMAPELWRRVGGDGGASDVREALGTAARLVGIA